MIKKGLKILKIPKISKKFLIIFILAAVFILATAFSFSYFTDRAIVSTKARSAKLGTTIESIFDSGNKNPQINSVYTVKPFSVKLKNDGDANITSDLEITAEWEGDSDINWIAFYPSTLSDAGIKNDVISGNRSLACKTVVSGKTMKITIPQTQINKGNSSTADYKIVLCDNDYSEDDTLNISVQSALAQIPRGFKDTIKNKLQIPVILPKETNADLEWEYTLNDSTNTITLTKYIGTNTDVTVENAYRVKHTIYKNAVLRASTAFAGNANIKNVTFENKVVFENNTAEGIFDSCTALTSVSGIPNSVTNLRFAFYGCTSLVSPPVLPSSAVDMDGAFSECTSLKTAPSIPAGVTNLKDAFLDCTSLKTAPSIPAGVTNMKGTFEGCTGLTAASSIPASVTDLRYTFKTCKSLVNPPDISKAKATSLSYTFYGCTNLKTAPSVPDTASQLTYTFYNCTSLMSAPVIPANVTDISYIFSGCTNLTGDIVVLSSKINSASFFANGTTKPLTVYVPADSTSYTTISGVSKPSNVTVTGYGELNDWAYKEETSAVSLFSASERDDVLLTKYNGSNTNVKVYYVYIKRNSGNYKFLNAVLNNADENSITGVFKNNKNIRTVNINNGVKIKDNNAEYMFYGCTNLTSVKGMPDSVINMEHTFDGCLVMPQAETLPSKVTNTRYTYQDCKKLSSAPVVPDTVKTDKAEYMFKGCTTLVTAPEMPQGITSLKDVFSGCTNLKNVPAIPNSVTNMENTFSGCTSLTAAPAIPANVTTMKNTFSGCTSLTSAPKIPDKVTTMECTFSGCTRLMSAPNYIPSGVTNMKQTFQNCSALTGKVIFLGSNIAQNNITESFTGTSKAITVYAPCASTTQDSINKIKPSNVSVKGYGLLDNWTHTVSGSNVILTKYNGSDTNVTVHDTYLKKNSGTYSVYNGVIGTSSSSSGPFVNNKSIKTVTIENGAEVQSDNAGYMFMGCTALTNVTGIPDSVTNMRASFHNCSALLSAPKLPSSAVSLWDTFYGCSNITSIPAIPSGVTNMIGTFNNCTKLTGSVPNLPNGVQSLNTAFRNTAITGINNIPTSAEDMYQAFYGCTKLTSLSGKTVPQSVSNLKQTFYNCSALVSPPSISSSCAATDMYYTFYGCSLMKSAPVLPSKITSLQGTFSNCSVLASPPVIPAGVTDMSYTFQNCTGITAMPSIPSKVTNMRSTFSGCTNLKTASVIPASAEDIRGLVWNCGSLTGNLIFLGKNLSGSYMDYNTFAATSKAITAYAPYGSTTLSSLKSLSKPSNVTVKDYGSLDDWTYNVNSSSVTLTKYNGSDTGVIVHDAYLYSGSRILDDVYIGQSTSSSGPFMRNTKIKTVDIDSGVSAAANNATHMFYYCTALTKVTGIPSGTTNMDNTFTGCHNLASAPSIPSSVTNMSRTFFECRSITTPPTIPSGVTNMDSTFYDCSKLTTTPYFPSGITSLDCTFFSCAELTTVRTLPSNLTNMRYTFYHCLKLASAPSIPSKVTNMECTFKNCLALKNITNIPSGVNNMQETFNGCTSLTAVPAIPASVKDIYCAFSGCTSLVNPPDFSKSTVTSMQGTFSNCTSLKTAPVIPNTVTDLSYTFSGCTKLAVPPAIPANVTNISMAFVNCSSLKGNMIILSENISVNKTNSKNPFSGTVEDIVLFPPEGSNSYTELSDCCDSGYFPPNVSISVIYPVGDRNGLPDIPWSVSVDSDNKIIYVHAIIIDNGDTYYPLYPYYRYKDEVYQTVIDFNSSPFDEPYKSVWESFFAHHPELSFNGDVEFEVDIWPNIPVKSGITSLDSMFRFFKIDGRDEYRSHLLYLNITWDMSHLTQITSMKNTFYGSVCLSGKITLPPNLTNVTNFYEVSGTSTIDSTRFNSFTFCVPPNGSMTYSALIDEYARSSSDEYSQFYKNSKINFTGISFGTSAYALSYDLNGGEVMSADEGNEDVELMSLNDEESRYSGSMYESSEIVELPDGKDLVRDGYEFAGWNTKPDAEKGFFEMLMPSEDVVLYAVWIEKAEPTASPTLMPTETPAGTAEPSTSPTMLPEPSIMPTGTPAETAKPSAAPIETPKGTAKPDTMPTETPTGTAKPDTVPTETPKEDENISVSGGGSSGGNSNAHPDNKTTPIPDDVITSTDTPIPDDAVKVPINTSVPDNTPADKPVSDDNPTNTPVPDDKNPAADDTAGKAEDAADEKPSDKEIGSDNKEIITDNKSDAENVQDNSNDEPAPTNEPVSEEEPISIKDPDEIIPEDTDTPEIEENNADTENNSTETEKNPDKTYGNHESENSVNFDEKMTEATDNTEISELEVTKATDNAVVSEPETANEAEEKSPVPEPVSEPVKDIPIESTSFTRVETANKKEDNTTE